MPALRMLPGIRHCQRFAEEGGFLVLGFGEGYGDLGAKEGDGDAGKAGSAAEVEEIGNVFRQELGTKDGFEEVAAEDAFFVPDGGEVGFGVPLLEEGEVGGEFFSEFRGQGWVAGFVEELVEAVCDEGHCSIVGRVGDVLHCDQNTRRERASSPFPARECVLGMWPDAKAEALAYLRRWSIRQNAEAGGARGSRKGFDSVPGDEDFYVAGFRCQG